MGKHLADARHYACIIKGTALVSNWKPAARVRAQRRGLVGANLQRYYDAVFQFLTQDLRSTFDRLKPL